MTSGARRSWRLARDARDWRALNRAMVHSQARKLVPRSKSAALALTVLHPQLKAALDVPVEVVLNRPARLYPWLDYGLRILDRFNAFQGVALMALQPLLPGALKLSGCF